MFVLVREFSDSEHVMVGRTVGGHRHSLYSVYLDRSYDGKDWCRNHGMKLIERVPNTTKTAWYEIWASDDLRLMVAFLI